VWSLPPLVLEGDVKLELRVSDESYKTDVHRKNLLLNVSLLSLSSRRKMELKALLMM
jgi:hypothetical protein